MLFQAIIINDNTNLTGFWHQPEFCFTESFILTRLCLPGNTSPMQWIAFSHAQTLSFAQLPLEGDGPCLGAGASRQSVRQSHQAEQLLHGAKFFTLNINLLSPELSFFGWTGHNILTISFNFIRVALLLQIWIILLFKLLEYSRMADERQFRNT